MGTGSCASNCQHWLCLIPGHENSTVLVLAKHLHLPPLIYVNWLDSMELSMGIFRWILCLRCGNDLCNQLCKQ